MYTQTTTYVEADTERKATIVRVLLDRATRPPRGLYQLLRVPRGPLFRTVF